MENAILGLILATKLNMQDFFERFMCEASVCVVMISYNHSMYSHIYFLMYTAPAIYKHAPVTMARCMTQYHYGLILHTLALHATSVCHNYIS